MLLALFPSRARAAESDPPHRLWLFFERSYLTDAPGTATARALERRTRRGMQGAGDQVVPDRLIAEIASLGVEVRMVSSLLGAASVVATERQFAHLETLPYVQEVRPVRHWSRAPRPELRPVDRGAPPGKTLLQSADPGLSEPFLRMINALGPIDSGINGSGILLGFLDTEFGDFAHRAFERHRASGRVVEIRNFTGQPQSNRHGQMVASVAAGEDDGYLLGPAHGATLIGAVTEYAPSETRSEEEFFVAGLEWLEEQGVDVVNVSLGYTDFDDDPGYAPDDLDGATATTTIAVQRAVDRGVVVVTSAGNSGCASPDACWYYVGTPADARGAIAVGGVGADSSRASFSSLGPTADGRIKPDVAAPGVRVPVAIGGDAYALASGTSFASPLVAGVACQLLQINSDLTPDDIQHILRSTAHQADAPDNVLGWGIVNSSAAVDAALRLKERPLPEIVTMLPPYPNPSMGPVRLDLDVPRSGFSGSAALYDVTGRRVALLFNGTLSPGPHSFTLHAPSVASGVYFFLLQGEGVRQSSPVVLIR